MKKSLFLLTLVGFLATQAYATPTKTRKTKAPKAKLEQQLAKYVSYPDVLQTHKAGVVVIQFRVNAENELSQLEVFSQNQQLNNALKQQLTGKKLVGYGSDTGEVYTVRLRFQPE
ncbi:hypothetical protein [Spirosoma montaniterrae]|uniref:TonB C-terminal domain-containing protein n=1 Tax=Spirosoma montaniterrae TaxID=1178516 RepID=A0A1P9WY01_9BACT|nr:hypothetical protein [Spirosoma montaniterrae]AQG80249.1 hypothetical protein AWR27_13535 [Spirosoma montaniterrae]